MPGRTDLSTIMVIGSGPIVIGQACEFDYSGTQACRVLQREGYRVVLVNSNPATIMTDPEFADRTYLEPLTPEAVLGVIERERPDALLPTIGGQTGLNVSVALAESGDLDRLGVELIGANLETIHRAEDRSGFKEAMTKAGLDVPRAGTAHTLGEALDLGNALGFPVIVRPSFTLGGGGSGFASSRDELAVLARRSLAASPVSEILVEESIAGWKEFELEVMRDHADNAVVVCSIENVDPMGVHTGDSVTVAPQQTLTDREYQAMRDDALACLRAVGVETGGSNVQFAVDPVTGRRVLIEMNPRVSRSSALASKATGFPIAKIAALLAVGYRLDEIRNDITGATPASFEPTLDYVVIKVPRFAFEKFPEADPVLTSTMKSVGEVMAIGRTFKEAFGKAWRGLEKTGSDLGAAYVEPSGGDALAALRDGTEGRFHLIEQALDAGHSVDEIAAASAVDPWFVDQMAQVWEQAVALRATSLRALGKDRLLEAKRAGLSDARIARETKSRETDVRARRESLGVTPVFKSVDTCGGEFPAHTPYHYSTYEEESEVKPATRPRVVILGAGPNRIGQGIEFDYACVHAAFALEEAGFDAVMINSNPETVSTDYDTSSRLYFEPLTAEDVLAVCHAERPVGVIAQLGGQTPLELARTLQGAGFRILGTSPDSIDLAEDRGMFAALLHEMEIPAPPHGEARTIDEARVVARRIGYPVVVRPSYVLGGRAMEIVYGDDELAMFVRSAAEASREHPVLIDRFLEGAIEVDVDAVCDGVDVFIGAVMEHIEEAGVHSGDSSCQIPPATLSDEELDRIEDITRRLARRIGVVGLLNLQLAVKDEKIWVLEANPRASRTVPFVSKVIGVSLARIATLVLAGRTLADLELEGMLPADAGHYRALPFTAVKAAVLPFGRFPGTDTVLGPEMRSTGEVMGIDGDPGAALAKAMVAAGHALPTTGTVFVSVANRDKRAIVFPAKRLADLGFGLLATTGTAGVLRRAGIPVEAVAKVSESSDNIEEMIRAGRVDLVINTPFGRGPRTDGYHIRTAAAAAGVPCFTTMPGAFAAVRGIEALLAGATEPLSIQEHHAGARGWGRVRRVRAEVLSTRKVGAYHQLTVVAPEIAEKARPGQFVAIQMPEGRDFLLRRHLAIHDASRRGGWAGTLEFVVDAGGPGTSWLASARAHSFLDLIGPLGKGFSHPRHLTNCLLVAERHGAATLYFLAQELVAAGKRVDMVVGAETLERVLKPIDAKRLSQTVAIVTSDGTLGDRGGVMDVLPEAAERTKAQVVYAAGPARTLERIAAFCKERGLPAQMALEERMGCGYGLCQTCVVPVARKDGSGYDNLRTCIDGPVFNPARVLWDRWLGERPTMLPTPPEGLPVVRAWPG